MRIARQIRRESYTVDYVGFWLRLLAAIIDGFILGAIIWVFNGLWPLAFGLGWMGGTGGASISYGEVGGIFWVLALLIPFLMFTAYLIGFWAWRGQTPAKMLLKMKIVRFTGEPIGWGGAVMRYMGFIMSFLLALLGHIWIAFDPRRQGLHDKIADTFVIRVSAR